MTSRTVHLPSVGEDSRFGDAGPLPESGHFVAALRAGIHLVVRGNRYVSEAVEGPNRGDAIDISKSRIVDPAEPDRAGWVRPRRRIFRMVALAARGRAVGADRRWQLIQPWEADVELSPELAARMIDDQFPALAPSRLERIGKGWDNSAYRVNGEFVFRFPRRKAAEQLIYRETRILPLLRAGVTLPIPNPEFIGRPQHGYPYGFLGYPILAGSSACRVEWIEGGRAGVGEALARFLRKLHRIPVDAETRVWASGDDAGRTNLPGRARVLRQRLESIEKHISPECARAVLRLTERLESTPSHPDVPGWIHGDLYSCHLLVDHSGHLCGIIDWGDAHLGDPALDLSIAFSFLPPSARRGFRESYGPVDENCWDRARFRALFYGVVLLHYGQAISDAPIQAAGRSALQGALRD